MGAVSSTPLAYSWIFISLYHNSIVNFRHGYLPSVNYLFMKIKLPLPFKVLGKKKKKKDRDMNCRTNRI